MFATIIYTYSRMHNNWLDCSRVFVFPFYRYLYFRYDGGIVCADNCARTVEHIVDGKISKYHSWEDARISARIR